MSDGLSDMNLNLENENVIKEDNVVKEQPEIKKPTEATIDLPPEESIEDFTNSLQADFNSTVDTSILGSEMEIVKTIPTGIDLLDAILGGGFGQNTFSMLVGNPGSYKSTILGQTMGNHQKTHGQKAILSYMDSENAQTTARLAELGVVQPPIKPINRITIEKVYKAIELQSAFKMKNEMTEIPSIVGWDSIANTPTQKELEDETDDVNKFIGLRARINTFLLPKYLNKMTDNNVALIAVNQLRDKMDMGMFQQANDIRWLNNKTIPGGNTLKFNAFHLLLFAVKGDLKFDQYDMAGVRIEVKCLKNKLFTPNIPITLIASFQKGVSNFWTNYQFLIDCKRLKAGAWNFLIESPENKFRTKDAPTLYKTNVDFKNVFDQQVKEAIQIEIIDKYKPLDPNV